jgi:arabinose-5-phosphate isomerase
MGLAPTASTTAALAMGDALAVALIDRRRFREEDFRRFHPGGSLGERLGIRVKEIMLTGGRVPSVSIEASVKQAVEEIHAKKIGATLVVNKDRGLEGIITDGDLRRALLRQGDVLRLRLTDILSPSPKTVDQEQNAAEALAIMELHGITHLVVLDRYRKVKGIVHLHDLLGREEFRVHAANQRTPGSHC